MASVTPITETTRCALVYNPQAGQLRRGLKLARLPRFSRSDREAPSVTAQRLVREVSPEVAVCVASDRAAAESFVGEAAQRRVPWLIIAGGDGTLFTVMNTLYRSLPTHRWPVLSVLPTGTTNFLAFLLGQPKQTIDGELFSRLPEVDRLPRFSVRLLQVGSYISLLCGAGLISRLSQAYVERPSHILDPYTWGVLNALAIGTGIWYPQWLHEAQPLDVSDSDGRSLRLPHGVPPAGLLCSAEERVVELWRPYVGDDRSDGVHALMVAKGLGSALRETVAARLRWNLRRRWAVARTRPRMQMKRGTWLMLDGEFVNAGPAARLTPGPVVELADLSSLSDRSG